MKLTIKKDLLQEGLNKVSKAISTKNLIPVLAGVKFELKKNKLVLTASDNDITIQTIIEGDESQIKIEKEGSIIIQGKYILDIVRKLPEEFINIEVVDELKILIYSTNSEFNLNGISEKEYPNIELEESKKPIIINSRELKKIVNETAFASSNDESKPILTGLNIKVIGDVLECNATDSYRLSRKIVKLNQSSDENYNIVVPSKNIVELVRILGDNDDEVRIHIFNNKILFSYKNILFQSGLINGNYPNTSNLIPTDEYLVFRTNISSFFSAIDRVSILTSDKEKNIVTLEINDDNLLLKSSSLEIGRVEEKMNVDKTVGDNIKISFSAKYMMEALKSFEDNEIEVKFYGEIKPIIVQNVENDKLIQLVLPIRTY